MKKKNIFYFLAGAALLFSTPACTDLDETVYDKISADDFGQTETELNALLGTVYKTLRNYPGDGNFIALEEESGSGAITPTRYGGDWYDGGQYREMYVHSWTSSTSVIKGAWSNASSSIGTCNANYSAISSSEGVLSDATKTQYLAEIRGVRAFWFYKMMDLWGNIPMVTSYDDKELPSCQDRQTVFNWLIEEVNDIYSTLPDRADNYNRFTKGAAAMLLAKLYLNADAWGVTTTVSNNYDKVVEYCDDVMAMGYSLESTWKDNFSNSNENSNEAILAVAFSESDGSSDIRWQLMNRTLHYKDQLALGGNFSAWNGVCAQPEYAELFDDDDPRFEGTYLEGQMYDLSTGEAIYTDHGYLLNHTIAVTKLEGTEYDGTNWGAVNQHDGVRCQKWEYSSTLADAMGNDFHIFRLADTYLMKAEALLRGGGSTATATSLVNAIRERAFGDSDHNYSTVDLDKVLLERRLELAWEQHNRQDDIRFGVYTTGMWEGSTCTRATDSYLELFPVSQDAYQSNPNLTQNPGYASFD